MRAGLLRQNLRRAALCCAVLLSLMGCSGASGQPPELHGGDLGLFWQGTAGAHTPGPQVGVARPHCALSVEHSLFSELLLWPAADSSRRLISARVHVDPRKKRDARISWFFLGATVLAGGASIYLKSSADDRYERYLRAGSPEAMNRYYDEACRLDRYAAAAYGTFQVSFVLWVIFFLKSR
ncbi:MAG: hypothetical protein H5U38_01765 [Calditrichaeota bacterium]|nr:hypothetical protein [Calditrichota bacterium]